MNETSTQRRAGPRSRHDRAADALQTPPDLPETAGPRPHSGRLWGMAGLVVLTAATSLVVATISIWLVPVYMAVMVLIFAAPRSNKPAESAPPPESPAGSAPSSFEAGVETVAEEGGDAETAEPTAPVGDLAEPAPAKPRKKRGKGKRAAKAAALAEASSSQPTWIRVGPGKFVRADDKAESPAESEFPTETADAPPADPESTPERGSVDPEMSTEATPAEACREEADDSSAVPSDPFEAAPTGSVEEYGNAPSALDGPFDEEHGNAPSALDETWEPEALPETVTDDAPEPDDEDDGREDVEEEAGCEERPETSTAHAGPSPTVAPNDPGRPTPSERSTASRVLARPVGVDASRRPAPIKDRPDPPRGPYVRGASSRAIRSGRTGRVRPRRTERGRRRTDATGRRPYPRSPPRRA